MLDPLVGDMLRVKEFQQLSFSADHSFTFPSVVI
jgi:hypothetical protein